MDNIVADFTISNNNSIEAEYTLNNTQHFDCSFELFAAGAIWGSITGNISAQTDLQDALNAKQNVLTAGDNIQIENNVISATDTTYTAGTGISIENGIISNTQTSAEWGNITGTLSAQTDLQDALLAKVDKAGDTMTGILKIRRSSGNEFLQIYPSVLLDEPPSTTRNIAMFVTYDTTGKVMAKALQNLGSDGSNTIKLTAWKPVTGQNAGIEAGWDANRIAFATAPETSTRRTNSTDIITRGYLNTYKQDKLVSGANIKTINNNSLLGSGNINLTASDVGALANTTTINDLTTTAQQNALNSGATASNIGQITTNQNNIEDIQSLIPAQASSSNQLADKDFVNSSIATNTANFIGTFNSVAELEAYTGTLTNNDYAFVATTDAAGNTLYDRYKYNADTQEWLFEYELNNSSFTAQQWASINSGATSTNIGQIATNASDIAGLQTNKQDVLTAGANIQINNNVISATDTTYTAGTGISIVNGVISNTQTSAEWGNIQGTLSNQTDLQNALNNKYDASNPDGFISGITSSDVTTALGYTPYNASNPNGYTSNVGTVTSVNNTQPDVNGNVTITIPDTATWGNITGTLSNQTDLQNALNAKLNSSDIEAYTANEVETLWESI